MIQSKIEPLYNWLLSERIKHKAERVVLWVAIVSYLIHLGLIVLNHFGIIQSSANFLTNPIAAIYTPFSFILVYEVYLLIFFLPKSISFYIGKQYEIITLIVIRRIFKDISNLELEANDWWTNDSDLQFTYDVVTTVALFILIFLFYRNIRKRKQIKKSKEVEGQDELEQPEKPKKRKRSTEKFILLKKGLAVALVPVLAGLAIFTLGSWIKETYEGYYQGIKAFKDINNVFFEEFFTALIVVDVLLLLFSFFYSGQFHKIIRNSGFVISTILLKISFSVDGVVSNALILGSVVFGLLMLIIHNVYEKKSIYLKL
ncbi:MAG: hypothetical protein AAGF87_00800 [Bacteroidota bacterium]